MTRSRRVHHPSVPQTRGPVVLKEEIQRASVSEKGLPTGQVALLAAGVRAAKQRRKAGRRMTSEDKGQETSRMRQGVQWVEDG